MSNESFPFKIGNFECMAVSDGIHIYAPPTFPPPPLFLFTNAPRDHLEHVLRKHNVDPERWAEWVSSYTCLVINTGKRGQVFTFDIDIIQKVNNIKKHIIEI